MTNTEEEKDKKKRKVWEVLADDYMMGRGKMKDFDNANGFSISTKTRGRTTTMGVYETVRTTTTTYFETLVYAYTSFICILPQLLLVIIISITTKHILEILL